MVSTLAGWARLLFSESSAAEVYCTIMKPLLRPPFSIKKAGKRPPCADVSTRRACLRSLMLASWQTAIPRKSAATERGAPWKLPPLRIAECGVGNSECGDDSAFRTPNSPLGKTSGLSLALFSSVVRTEVT